MCVRARSSSGRWTSPTSEVWRQPSFVNLENAMFLSLFAAAPDDNFGKFFADYWWLVLGGAVVLIFLLVFLVICLSFLRLWIQAWLTSAKIGFVDMIRMKLLNVDYA